MSASAKSIQYRCAAVGNRAAMIDSDGGRFTYVYDALHRISHLENPQNERTTYAYDADGRRTVKLLANGTRASFTYDDANNLTRLANLKSDGTTISSFAYAYAYDKTGLSRSRPTRPDDRLTTKVTLNSEQSALGM